MPAKDFYHDTVVRALEKDGWLVLYEQVTILIGNRYLMIDLEATKELEMMRVLIEVKSFENMSSPIEHLANAVGKYILYQSALESLEIATPLYMAVSIEAYNGILSEPIGLSVIERAKIKLVIFNPIHEEIIQWIP